MKNFKAKIHDKFKSVKTWINVQANELMIGSLILIPIAALIAIACTLVAALTGGFWILKMVIHYNRPTE